MSKTKSSSARSNSSNFIMILFAAFFLWSCEGEVDTRGVATELKERKIRKITDSQILSAAENDAALILSVVDSIWKAKLTSRKDGEIKACDLDSIYSLYKEKFNVEVLRVGLNPLDLSAKGDSIQRQLLDSYLYNAEKNLPMKSNTQRLGTKHIMYTSPIIIKSEDCLSCHGSEKSITEKNSLSFSKIYPAYKPQNFQKDSLIGIWSITFLKKNLISKIK